jgi:hypothetical protein
MMAELDISNFGSEFGCRVSGLSAEVISFWGNVFFVLYGFIAADSVLMNNYIYYENYTCFKIGLLVW